MQEKQGGENHELAPPTIVTESEVQPNPNLDQDLILNSDQSGPSRHLNLDQDLILNPDQTGSSRHLYPDQSGSTNYPNLNQSRLDPSFNPDQSGLNPNPNPNGSTIVTISEICERSKDHVDVGILLDTDA
jgi:hypothetical protein